MLKSTHHAASSRAAAPLPAGWTEHRAPTGHPYYYNTETKQSTYTRPVAEPEVEELIIDYGATEPDREVQASLNALQEFQKNSDPSQVQSGPITGGRNYQDRDRNRHDSRSNRQGDRPKFKAAIPNCAPWLLVKTKYGRRFVHNTETKESLWKFPSEVMMAVIDMDRVEWEKKTQIEQKADEAATISTTEAEAKEFVPDRTKEQDYDSDEYEEVEVTDDEDENAQDPKRPRLEELLDTTTEGQPPPGPQEFNEDDIAWQLAQMEADEDDPGYDFDFDDQDADEEGGMPLTREDKEALFRSLLDEYGVSPFSTFDSLIDTNTPTANAVIGDDRWTALPNMSSRRIAFDAWSRDRVAERKVAEENPASHSNGTNGTTKKAGKVDPRIAYLRFLSKAATTKLYWPEFKRKFKKAPEMTDRYYPDKDREKLYREYVTKLKLSDADRKKEFLTLLKSAPNAEWEDGLVPEKVEKDIKFYGVRDENHRRELVAGFRGTTH